MSTNSSGINNLLLWVWNQFCTEAPETTDPDYMLQEELFFSRFSLSAGLLSLLAQTVGQALSRVPCCWLKSDFESK